jgi:sugar O-acyltransferase (sialic acid O-acetyltransferase NeuD family)
MKKALIGYGGHAREVMAQMGTKLTCFVDDEYVTEYTKPISEFNPLEYTLMVAIADSTDRFNMIQRLPKETKFFTFIHKTSQIIGDDVIIGEGSFIGANSILTTNIKLGKHTILNRGNHVGHDTIIGDYFSAMPGAIISGNVNIGNCVYIGTNSSVREKINITSNTILGLNSGVVKDISIEGTYGGCPVKLLNYGE